MSQVTQAFKRHSPSAQASAAWASSLRDDFATGEGAAQHSRHFSTAPLVSDVFVDRARFEGPTVSSYVRERQNRTVAEQGSAPRTKQLWQGHKSPATDTSVVTLANGETYIFGSPPASQPGARTAKKRVSKDYRKDDVGLAFAATPGASPPHHPALEEELSRVYAPAQAKKRSPGKASSHIEKYSHRQRWKPPPEGWQDTGPDGAKAGAERGVRSPSNPVQWSDHIFEALPQPPPKALEGH